MASRTFLPKVDITTGSDSSRVEISDVDGDGTYDLVVGMYGLDVVSVHRGNGDGTFQPRFDYPTAGHPRAMGPPIDMTGDGILDIVTGNENANSISLLIGNGDGTFQQRRDFDAGMSPWAIDVADVDGDGVQDVAIANYYANSVSILCTACP